MPAFARQFASAELAVGRGLRGVPRGCILAVCDLTDCRSVFEAILEIDPAERLYGDYTIGRYAFKLENVKVLRWPVGCKGSLGLWTPSLQLQALIDGQVAETTGPSWIEEAAKDPAQRQQPKGGPDANQES
jgi:hypothetical protein